jgi:ParB family chromosome partitioning protein
MALLAHCVSLSGDAVQGWQRRPLALAHADALEAFIGLDMTGYWTPTARSYFERVTKAPIGEAVREAVSDEAAERIASLRKPEMAAAAEQLVAAPGWLPPLLRTAVRLVEAEAPAEPGEHPDVSAAA